MSDVSTSLVAGPFISIEKHRPLVAAVCGRYLRGADAEDAVQETFLRWFQKGAGQPIESIPAWLARVAQTVCMDILRRRQSNRRRLEGVAKVVSLEPQRPDLAAGLRSEAIANLLPWALKQLSVADQKLLAARFLAGVPLRVISAQTQMSIATLSRRSTAAVETVAGLLRERGVVDCDQSILNDWLHESAAAARYTAGHDDGLRPAADRRQLEARLRSAFGDVADAVRRPQPVVGPLMPGWTRPIRVGVLVHYGTMMTLDRRGTFVGGDLQAISSTLLTDPRFELVAVVEPRTSQFGPVERTIREYELLGGLIEATDVTALSTLDVLIFGVNIVVTLPVLEAIRTAVGEHSVGFLKDGWLAAEHTSTLPTFANELLLARSPVVAYHTPGRCGQPSQAVVVAESPLLNLSVGTPMRVGGCAPAFEPLPGAKVLIQQKRIVSPQEHGIPGVGPLPIPMFLTGQIGNGRAAVITIIGHGVYYRTMLPDDYFPKLVAWLAEPRRMRD